MGQRGSSLNDDSDSKPSSLPTIKTDQTEDKTRTRQESELPIINPLNVGEREKYYFFGRNNSIRKKFHYCGDCPYRAYHKKPLKIHIKKLHPSSTTALPVSTLKALKKPKEKCGQLKKFIKKNISNGRHNFIPKLGCSRCKYRTNLPHRMRRHEQLHHKKSAKRQKDVYNSHTNNQNEEWSWFYPLNGGPRFRIYCCSDCGFKANRSDFVNHVMTIHLSSSSALSPKLRAKKPKNYQCADCEYETKNSGHFKRHRSFHDEKSAHICPWCSYSLNVKNHLARHVRLFHYSKIDKKGLIAGENEYRFHCTHCPFKTKHKFHLERHIVHHRDPAAEHQCHLCSFSVNYRGSLTLHLKLHFLDMDENNNNKFEDQLNTENDRGNKRVTGSSVNRQISLLSCRDCRLFKTTSRFTLKRHVKRAHPFSLSALPPLFNKRPKTNHLKKSGLKVGQETHQPVEDALVSTPEGAREEWYVAPNGKNRQRYNYCGDCNYRTTSRYNMVTHAEKMHPSSTTAIPSQPQPLGTQLFNCFECDFSTNVKSNIDRHKMSHQRTGKYKCSHCSFSSNFQSSVDKHFKSGHHQNLKSTRIEEVRSEERLRKQFGIKECLVVLHNILSPLIKVLSLENEGEDNPVDEIQLLKIRLKAMEERARIAEEEVEEISSKKMNVQKRIDEIERRKAMIEYLRSQQCNPLEMNLSAPDAEVDFGGIFTEPVEDKVNCLETEMKVIDCQLGALKEEGKCLGQDLEYAQESHSGVVQVIEALQSELDAYLFNNSV